MNAATRLEAYERVTRAALAAKYGSPNPVVLQLSDEMLARLFAPRQLDSLVNRPLRRPDPCPKDQDT